MLLALGELYERRLGEAGHAEACYHRAARHGSLTAMTRLGTLLLTQERRDEALRWLHRGAETGDPDAQYHLAAALDRYGEHTRALAHLHRAARAGHPLAMCALAVHLYLQGHPRRARRWYDRARACADPRAADPEILLGILLSRRPARFGFRRRRSG